MKRALVVDDDPDITVYLSSLLGDNDYQVATANDSGSALEAMAAFEPDVVLLDVLLPGRSGLDLLVTLREDPRWSHIALVVMTGMDQILEDDCQSYLGSHHNVRGPDAVLGKPVDPKALLAVLAALTKRQADPASAASLREKN